MKKYAACILQLAALGFFATRAVGQSQTKESVRVPTPGARLYKQNCALCHGNDGKGNGPPPASSIFKGAPPDLTTLSQRHDGKFPEKYVVEVLRSGVKMLDHGPAEMPVWGKIFSSASPSGQSEIDARIANLTAYLKSIQAK